MQETALFKSFRVVSAVESVDGMKSVKRVRAHVTTRMYWYFRGPEDLPRKSAWSTWITVNGRAGVGIGFVTALLRGAAASWPHTSHVSEKAVQSLAKLGQ